MSRHPLGWTLWDGGVVVLAVVATNPVTLAVALGAVIVVHLATPPTDGPAARAVRTFVGAGLVLLVLRLVFVSLLSAAGETVLVTLPRWQLPAWVGGFGLGGPVTAEVLVEGISEGLRLVVVLAATGVLNERVDLGAVIRMVPAPFRDAGLVISIAIAFVPGLFRTVADVRDAQRLRGERGWRGLSLSLVIPVLGLTLERALLLAESMDVRGYGRGAAPSSSLTLFGLTLVLGGVAAWVGTADAVGGGLVAAGGLVLAWSLRRAARAGRTTRLRSPRASTTDVVAGASGAAGALAAVVSGAVGYTAYPVVGMPDAGPAAVLPAVLLAAPALWELARPSALEAKREDRPHPPRADHPRPPTLETTREDRPHQARTDLPRGSVTQ